MLLFTMFSWQQCYHHDVTIYEVWFTLIRFSLLPLFIHLASLAGTKNGTLCLLGGSADLRLMDLASLSGARNGELCHLCDPASLLRTEFNIWPDVAAIINSSGISLKFQKKFLKNILNNFFPNIMCHVFVLNKVVLPLLTSMNVITIPEWKHLPTFL